jgi:hypothetical protein
MLECVRLGAGNFWVYAGDWIVGDRKALTAALVSEFDAAFRARQPMRNRCFRRSG